MKDADYAETLDKLRRLGVNVEALKELCRDEAQFNELAGKLINLARRNKHVFSGVFVFLGLTCVNALPTFA